MDQLKKFSFSNVIKKAPDSSSFLVVAPQGKKYEKETFQVHNLNNISDAITIDLNEQNCYLVETDRGSRKVIHIQGPKFTCNVLARDEKMGEVVSSVFTMKQFDDYSKFAVVSDFDEFIKKTEEIFRNLIREAIYDMTRMIEGEKSNEKHFCKDRKSVV